MWSFFLKYMIVKILFVLLLISITASRVFAFAEQKPTPVETKKLYKVVDENGKIHYSDQPSPDAEEVDLPDIPSISIRTPKIKIKSLEDELEERREAERDPNADYYGILKFTNLVNDGVIRNNGGTATFSVVLEPLLSRGHYLKFYIDGNLIQSEQKELTITAQEVTYGPHTASFSVVSKQGTVVQQSASVNFILLHVVRKNTSANQNNIPSPFENTAIRAEFFNQNLPQHPRVPTFEALQQAANRSTDN